MSGEAYTLWCLRPARPEDAAFLFALYAATRADELAACGWAPAQVEAFLRLQFEARRRGYAATFPQATRQIVEWSAEPIGALMVARTGSGLHVVDIALLPAARNRGVGAALLRGVQREAAAGGGGVSLNVRRGSAAERLYRRLGFEVAASDEVDQRMEWRA